MPNSQELLAQLNTIFQDVLDEDEINLAAETTADDVEEWDSLAHVQLIVAIEKHFGIKFTSQEINGFSTVGDMLSTIATK